MDSFKSHSNIDWDFISSTIENEKCVLLIGPEVPQTIEGINANDALTAYLRPQQKNLKISDFDQKDGLITCEKGAGRTRICYKIRQFYEQTQFNTEMIDKIASIPFHCIISLNPDDLLPRVFNNKKIEHDFGYYTKNTNPQNVKKPHSASPLIYNLFGCIKEDNSLILTHEDLYDFIFSIVGKYQLPSEIRNVLATADNFIFLGFHFDKWYLQILLRLLKFNDDGADFERYACNNELSMLTRKFYEDHFNLVFVDHKIDDFVNRLHQQCVNKNIVRKNSGAASLSVSEQASQLVASDEIDETLALLLNFFENNEPDTCTDITLMISQHNRLKKRISSGIINAETESIERNKLRVNILDYINEVRKLEKHELIQHGQ